MHEAARDVVRNLRDAPEYLQSRRDRKKVEMKFAHLKRILRLGRLRLRGPCGARDEFHTRRHRPEPTQISDDPHLVATAYHNRRVCLKTKEPGTPSDHPANIECGS